MCTRLLILSWLVKSESQNVEQRILNVEVPAMPAFTSAVRNSIFDIRNFRCFCLVLSLVLGHPVLHAQRSPDNSALVDQFLQRAASSIQAGELNSAEGELRKAIKLAPDNVAALAMLGGVLGMQGRLEESSRLLEKALQLDPGNRDVRRNLAANQIQAHRTSAAIGNLETLLKIDPGDREAILMLGFAWELAENFVRALQYLEQVPDLVEQHPDHIAALVRSYYRTGQKDKARRRLSQLQDSGASPASVYLGAQMALEADDFETAERLFESIKSSHPEPDRINYQLARIRYQEGRFDECKVLLEPIANSPESNGSVLNLLAWCYVKDGDRETATKIFHYASDNFPAEAANFVDLARLCLDKNNLDAGLEVVRRGVARHPGSGSLMELKGEIESKMGLLGPAAQSYEQAVRLNPRSREALLGLAIAQTNLLRHKDAVATFEKGLRIFPQDARFYGEYGKILLLPWASQEGPQASVKAEQLLKKAIQLDGSYAMAHFELGNLLAKNQRAAEALPFLERASKLDPGNSQIHFVLARTYRALGRTEEAERERLVFEKLEPSVSGKAPKSVP